MSTSLPKVSYYFYVLLLICHSETALSVLILTPTIVSLCPGDQLRLTCNTSTHFQRWAVIDPNTEMTYTRTIEVPATSRAAITPLEVQSFTFSFAIISAPNTLPLISILTVDGVTNYLHTSRISCVEIDTGNSEMVNVHIIRPNTLEGVHVDTMFGINNTSVTIQFNDGSQENDYYGSKTGFQLVIPYNIHVSVSIVASLCEQHRTPQTIFHLNYTNCGDPPVKQSDAEMNDSVKITGNNTQDIPVTKGTTVSFSCHPGLILSGPNSSTCMGNGEWEPDPREVECRVPSECEIPVNKNKVVYEYNSTIEGSKVIFYCEDNPDDSYIAQCYGNETWIPNINLITCGNHDQSNIKEADCGPPPSPQNGHIVQYNNTSEGAEVTYVCWSVHQENTSQYAEIYTTAICNEKGKWESKSDDICSVFSGRSFEQLSQEGKIAVASSVTVFTVTSILFYITGFLSGHFCCNKDETVSPPSQEIQTPYYDDVVLKQHEEQQLELRDNVAYVSHNVTN